ncbi:uncharacterized protein LOC128883793 [Hylaeus volcanicus]|uniref:uncharacterized protein LOC128883793 n=1 Tax=Hylaeus volcanicus TaxID=313075 RepID=UPI0023B8271A|nr:uncharacterized protein LOC128883793 [Hylaeus volcanicus]
MKSETDLKAVADAKKNENSYDSKKAHKVLPYVASSKSVYSNPLKYYESQVFAKEIVPKVHAQNQFSFLLSLQKEIDQEETHSDAISSKKDERLSIDVNEIPIDDMLLDEHNLGDDSKYDSLFPESMDQIHNNFKFERTLRDEKHHDDNPTHSDSSNTILQESLADKDYKFEPLLEDAVVQPSRFFVCFPCIV